MKRGAGRALRGALAVVLLASTPAWAGFADRVGATFGLMIEDVVRAFAPLEGIVVAIEGDSIFLDLGRQAGVQVGQEFTIYRRGDVFRHSLTGRPLGRYEQVLGWAQVRQVQPEFADAVFVARPGQPTPVPTDGARITKGRIKVAITPLLDLTGGTADTRRVPYLIAMQLEGSRRFQVVDPLTVGDMLASTGTRVEEVLARPARAAAAARRLEVAGWLVPVVLERRGVFYLDVTWISAMSGTALFSRRQPLLAAAAAEEARFPWEPRVED